MKYISTLIFADAVFCAVFILLSGCSVQAPVEDMDKDQLRAYIAELEDENAELDSEISELWGDVDWLEFRIEDEKSVCKSEIDKISDLAQAKTLQVRQKESEYSLLLERAKQYESALCMFDISELCEEEKIADIVCKSHANVCATVGWVE